MNTEKDPLRFLKPRKKQFHLTTTQSTLKKKQQQFELSSVNLTQEYTFLHQNIIKSLSNFKQNQKINSSKSYIQESQELKNIRLRQNEYFNQMQQNNNLNRTQNKNDLEKRQIYNPLKYFSKDVENYLKNKKNGINSNKTNIEPNKIQQKQQKQSFKEKHSIVIDKSLGDQFIIPLKKNEEFINEPNQNTVRLQDYFEPSQKLSQLDMADKNNQKLQKSKLNQIEQLNKARKNVIEMNKKVEQISTMNFINNQQVQNEQPYCFQFKQCEICGRKFNPTSYDKHVKICQKVFFKKRKQFSSQKQRSQSKDRKK